MSVTRSNRMRRRLVAVALATLTLTLTAACGSGGSSSTPASGKATAGGTAQAQLPVKKATGTPVVVGLINDDTSPLGNFSNVSRSVKVAVQYVNNNLGGAGGHPLKLVSCLSNGSSASSANCAAQLLQQKPSVVIGGLDLGADGSVPAFAKAGVPYVAASAISSIELTSPDSYSFYAGSAGSVAAGSTYVATTLHSKKAAVIFTQSPQAQLAAQYYGADVLKAGGVSNVSLVSSSSNETDLTGPLNSALKGGTDSVIGIMAANDCASVMQAKQSLGSTAKFLFSGACADPDVLKAGGAGAEGTYFALVQTPPNGDDAQTTAYHEAIAAYDSSLPASSFAQGGFGTVVTLAQILGTATSPDAPASVTRALKAVKGLSSDMGPEITCDGKQMPGLPALCTNQARIAQVQNGALKDVGGRWYTG